MDVRAPAFDAYHKWLGIPPAEQPPHHYRLLGVAKFEDDADVIAAAADRQMAHVKSFAAGPRAAESQSLLNELARARVVLLNSERKRAYDLKLRRASENCESNRPLADQSASQTATPRPTVRGEEVQLEQLSRLERHSQRQTLLKKRRQRSTGFPTLLATGSIVIIGCLAYAFATRPLSVPKTATESRGSIPKPTWPHRAEPAESTTPSPTPEREPARPPSGPGAESRASSEPDAPRDLPAMPQLARTTAPRNAPRVIQSNPREPTKTPKPGAEATRRSRAQIHSVFASDFSRLRTGDDRMRLALKLIGQADATDDDPAAAFALYLEAIELATDAPAPALAMSVAERVDERFECDPLQAKTNIALSLAEKVRTVESSRELCEEVEPLLEQAIKLDRFSEAKDLAETFLSASRRARQKELRERAANSRGRVAALEEAYLAVGPAWLTLESDPHDPEASAAIGSYLALAKGDWARALPLLAQGADTRFQEAAAAELSSSLDDASVAERWEAVAARQTGEERVAVLCHAAECYRRAAANLKGINRTEAIAAIQRLIDEGAVAPLRRPLGEIDYFGVQQVAAPAAAVQSAVIHMPPPEIGFAAIRFRLDGRYRRLTGAAWIRPDEGQRFVERLVKFEIYADDRLVWHPDPFDEQGREKRFNVDVQNVDVLTLQVEGVGETGRAYADAEWKDVVVSE